MFIVYRTAWVRGVRRGHTGTAVTGMSRIVDRGGKKVKGDGGQAEKSKTAKQLDYYRLRKLPQAVVPASAIQQSSTKKRPNSA